MGSTHRLPSRICGRYGTIWAGLNHITFLDRVHFGFGGSGLWWSLNCKKCKNVRATRTSLNDATYACMKNL